MNLTPRAKRFASLLPDEGGVCLVLGLVAAAMFLLLGIDRAGIWDPHELDRAELARRIAIDAFGARGLAMPGSPNGMPTLTDLGSGELGFTSIAAGFALGGLHPVAGRLPLALWGVAGAVALYALVARFASPRAALVAVVALVTMPAYFLQARTMLGDVVAMASFAICLSGFGGALLEERRAAAAAFAVLGLAGAFTGFLSRGLLIGVTAPCLGVGLGWLALAGELKSWRARAVGSLCLAGAIAAAVVGARPIREHGFELREVKRVVGAAVQHAPLAESTFDLVVRDLGHALFPWSALLPVCFALVVARGRRGGDPLGTLLLVAAASAYAVHALLSLWTGPLPFAGVAALAAIVGVSARELDRAPSLPLGAAATLVLAYVLVHDLLDMPDKALVAFGVADPDVPIGAAADLGSELRWAAGVFAGVVGLTLFAAPPEAQPGLRERLRERHGAYVAALQSLGRVWRGNLAFGFLLLEAVLVGLGGTLLIGRRLGWPSVVSVPYGAARVGLNLWWLLPLGLLLVPIALDAARAAVELGLRALRLPRSAGLLVAAVVSAAILCFGYYPALAAQLSPREALDAYARLHRPGEPLGLLGVSGRMGRYHSRGDATTALSSPNAASEWLAGGAETRWLAFREGQLAELNARYRAAAGANLGVLDTGGGQILLAVSDLGDLRANANPLEPFIGAEAPAALQHELGVRFGEELQAIGWGVVDGEGRAVAELLPGVEYRLRFHYRVLARIGRSYRAFVHIDAEGVHHTIDHEVIGGLYPMTWWQPGDHVTDEHAFALPHSFLPGRYALYFGFYVRDDDRYEVTEGRHQSNRALAGIVMVR